LGSKREWTFINIPRGIGERTSHCEDSSKKNNATRYGGREERWRERRSEG